MQHTPTARTEFVETQLSRTLATLVNSPSRLILLVGPPGSGKTETARKILRDYANEEPVFISGTKTTGSEALLGHRSFRNGQVVFDDGQLVRALKNGKNVVFDDAFLVNLDQLSFLLQLRSENHVFVHPETGETVEIPRNWKMVATSNRSSVEMSCRRDSETGLAILDGAQTLLVDAFTRPQVEEIVRARVSTATSEQITATMEIFDLISIALESHENQPPLSIRATISIAEQLAHGLNRDLVTEMCVNKFLPLAHLHAALSLHCQFEG